MVSGAQPSKHVARRSEEDVSGTLTCRERQHENGKVLISGPTPDRAIGIYVLKAVSYDEAKALADTAPFHVAGLRSHEIIEWEIQQVLCAGTFTKQVSTGYVAISKRVWGSPDGV